LTGLGFDFKVEPAGDDAENGVGCSDPFELAEVLARRKCSDVSARFPDALVIAADTVVIVDGEVLSKPEDDDQATRFLTTLSGRTHTVVTGVALERRDDNVKMVASEKTQVTFRDLTAEEISAYVATGEGRDKAGSYAAQGLGSSLIRSIDGCFYNVVGLPIALLFEMMKKMDRL
jgi:septum formation protein